jgi:hypothetical protein
VLEGFADYKLVLKKTLELIARNDGGHYIVLRGITEDGYALVNDPGSRNRNKYAYKLSTVVSQTKTNNPIM